MRSSAKNNQLFARIANRRRLQESKKNTERTLREIPLELTKHTEIN